MSHPICATCGTQFSGEHGTPTHCPVCTDERQYVGWQGQSWTSLAELRQGHHLRMADDDGVFSLDIEPAFGIGQRAALVPTAAGNLLWESLSLVTDAAVAALRERGGVEVIAISHPHFYSAMLEWSEALGNVPILLHAADCDWVRRTSPRIEFWSGPRLRVNDSLTLIHCPGHFPGSTVMHWREGAHGGGALLPGDAVQVVSDRRHVSFMYSYPNLIPLPARDVLATRAALAGFEFEDAYGYARGRNLIGAARAAVDRSFDRYLAQLGEPAVA